MVILLAVVMRDAGNQREMRLEGNPPLAHESRVGLFSPPEKRVASADVWRRGAFEMRVLEPETVVAWRPGEPPVVVPAFAAAFAADCVEFKPLAQHLEEYAGRHFMDSLQVEELARQCALLREHGLLVSAASVRERWSACTGGAGRLSALGFVTGGARQALLERGLRSFAENLRRHGRKLDLLVADSSRHAQDETATRGLLEQFEEPVYFAGEREKRAFIEQLVSRGACSLAVGEFAFLDPLETGFVCGGNRNVLLLQGAGAMFGSLDDDVICRLSPPPSGASEERACFSGRDPYARWLYRDREASEGAAVELDYAGLHETLLGRGAGDVLPVDFRLAGDGLLDPARGRVRATFTGHGGDPGIPSSAYYLYYDRENRARLCASEAHYRAVFPSRSVVAMAPAPMLGDASLSPGMAMALDHRELLPPFFPVLHAEDFSWGATLWQCCPEALLGHLPFAIRHSPPAGKGILTPGELGPGRRSAIFEFAHLLRRLVFVEVPGREASAEERMKKLGRFLQEQGELGAGEFRDLLRRLAIGEVSDRVQYLSHQLEEFAEAPAFWRADVEHLIAQLTGALEDEDGDIPLDLQTDGAPAATRLLMQRLLARYGALLQAWPGMVAATRELCAAGITPMRLARGRA